MPYYTVKGFKCHSNHSSQLFELKKKKQQQNNTRYFRFLRDIRQLSRSCNTQYFHTTEDTYTRLTYVVIIYFQVNAVV